jgi:hypothetical protein
MLRSVSLWFQASRVACYRVSPLVCSMWRLTAAQLWRLACLMLLIDVGEQSHLARSIEDARKKLLAARAAKEGKKHKVPVCALTLMHCIECQWQRVLTVIACRVECTATTQDRQVCPSSIRGVALGEQAVREATALGLMGHLGLARDAESLSKDARLHVDIVTLVAPSQSRSRSRSRRFAIQEQVRPTSSNRFGSD